MNSLYNTGGRYILYNFVDIKPSISSGKTKTQWQIYSVVKGTPSPSLKHKAKLSTLNYSRNCVNDQWPMTIRCLHISKFYPADFVGVLVLYKSKQHNICYRLCFPVRFYAGSNSSSYGSIVNHMKIKKAGGWWSLVCQKMRAGGKHLSCQIY